MAYVIYNKDRSKSFIFDKHFDDTTPTLTKTHVQNRTQINTFGQFPYVYYAGNTNYVTYSLSTILMPENNRTAVDQFNDFMDFLREKGLIVVDGFGREILADISLTSINESKLGENGYHDYIEVVVEVTELGAI